MKQDLREKSVSNNLLNHYIQMFKPKDSWCSISVVFFIIGIALFIQNYCHCRYHWDIN